MRDTGLRRRLAWLIAIRAVVGTILLGSATLLEPIMIAVLGIVVGGIVIAMYLPIFDLISKLT